ncbi:hypothetical protein ACTWP4_18635 [Gracilibacillus sp. D59]|uniref:hypothetical protein n=1 Tax=Gracilibacillus sp. D59 TaxID=3457434 RepID=UPI003FCC59ED
MAKKLTAGVLQGTAYREDLPVEWDGQEYEIEIRALSNKECTQVEELLQEGVYIKGHTGLKGKMRRSMDLDMKKNLQGRKDSDVKAVALGTTDEAITEKVVNDEFPQVLIKVIADRIKKISGIANEKDAEEFTEDEETPSEQERE